MKPVEQIRAICEELYNQTDALPARKDVLAKCEEQGLNRFTSQSTYAKWKKTKTEQTNAA